MDGTLTKPEKDEGQHSLTKEKSYNESIRNRLPDRSQEIEHQISIVAR
jgi:hypothetical protein